MTRNKLSPNSDKAKIWAAIRAIRKFDADELVTLTGCGHSNIVHYLSILHAAGYLRITSKKGRGLKHSYLLLKDTGVKAPVQKSLRCLYDPNVGEYWIELTAGATALTVTEGSHHVR